MPTNVKRVAVDPTEWNRNDGFSPGQPLTLFVPGVDLRASGAAPVTDIGASLDRDAPIVVLDATTGKRNPYWAELDVSATRDGETDPALYVRPAVNYVEGHHYVVGFRHLKNGSGVELQPTAAFLRLPRSTVHRELLRSRPGARRWRRCSTSWLAPGCAARDLYLAWDFTVASERNLSERVLRMRNDAMQLTRSDGRPTLHRHAGRPGDRHLESRRSGGRGHLRRTAVPHQRRRTR